MKTKIILTITLIIYILISVFLYNSYRKENKQLVLKNNILINKIDSVNNIINNTEYIIWVDVKRHKIKLGDKYEAMIHFSQIPKIYKPNVIVGDVQGDSIIDNLKDTLKVIDEYNTFYYKTIPQGVGLHTWGGTFTIYPNNRKEQYIFNQIFEVEK